MIDGHDTPEHNSHQNGKDSDIRNAPFTSTEEKKFLELCVANSGVQQIIYKTNHGIISTKIKIDSNHDDHFHVDFV